jgi:hypothetical protein
MKTFHSKHHGQPPILIKNDPHSKALESVCLSRFHLPPIATQVHPHPNLPPSRGKEAQDHEPYHNSNYASRRRVSVILDGDTKSSLEPTPIIMAGMVPGRSTYTDAAIAPDRREIILLPSLEPGLRYLHKIIKGRRLLPP